MLALDWDDQTLPVLLSQNPTTEGFSVLDFKLTNRDALQGVFELKFVDATGMPQGELLYDIQSSQVDIVQNHVKHGFSSDGAWFWWAQFKQQAEIHWVPLQGQEVLEILPRQFDATNDFLRFSHNGRYLLISAPSTTGIHKIFDLEKQEVVFESSAWTQEIAQKKSGAAFHLVYPWFLHNGKVASLLSGKPVKSVEYPAQVELYDFHPHYPWAVGVCAQNIVCIADLEIGQIIFHVKAPKIYNAFEKQPQQLRFSKNGEFLYYVIGQKTLIQHDLSTSMLRSRNR